MKTFNEIMESGKIWNVQNMAVMNCGLIKLPDCKTCTVVWSDDEMGWEHVSVAPTHQFTIPSWNDMCELKDIFFGDEEEVYQIHPSKSQYVNIKENCLHLWKPKGIDLQQLVKEKEGGKNENYNKEES